MNAIADANGFAVCYPQGTKDSSQSRFWNVGYEFHQDETVNDSDFLKSLALYLQAQHNLNFQYTFATGMSNGGDMCYMLACEQPETFKAIAPISGSMMEWIYNSCPVNSVPVFEIHGTNDDITLWEGDMDNSDGWGAYLSVPDTFNFWVQQNNCTQTLIENLPNIDNSDGSTVTSEKRTSGINNNEVWLYTVNNGGHDWPGSWGNMDIDSSTEIWNFFNNYINNNTLNIASSDFEKSIIYPNPTTNYVNIKYIDLKETRYELFSIYGKLMHKGIVSSHSNRIDISSFSNGLYILKLDNQTFKIIKGIKD
jgi:polyhydroxybutyrate depolymerase